MDTSCAFFMLSGKHCPPAVAGDKAGMTATSSVLGFILVHQVVRQELRETSSERNRKPSPRTDPVQPQGPRRVRRRTSRARETSLRINSQTGVASLQVVIQQTELKQTCHWEAKRPKISQLPWGWASQGGTGRLRCASERHGRSPRRKPPAPAPGLCSPAPHPPPGSRLGARDACPAAALATRQRPRGPGVPARPHPAPTWNRKRASSLRSSRPCRDTPPGGALEALLGAHLRAQHAPAGLLRDRSSPFPAGCSPLAAHPRSGGSHCRLPSCPTPPPLPGGSSPGVQRSSRAGGSHARACRGISAAHLPAAPPAGREIQAPGRRVKPPRSPLLLFFIRCCFLVQFLFLCWSENGIAEGAKLRHPRTGVLLVNPAEWKLPQILPMKRP